MFPFVFSALLFFAFICSREFKHRTVVFGQGSFVNTKPSRYHGSYLFLSFVILFFFHSFKDPYSLPDLDQYLSGFNEVVKQTWAQLADARFRIDLKAEFGWVILNKIVSVFSNNYIALFFVSSILILLGPYQTIRKYCPQRYIWIAVILYFSGSYLQSLFVLRQHLAISICLLSIPSVLKGNWKKYVVCCLLALSFHYSAIIWFPVYLIYQIKNKKALIGSLSILALLIIIAYSIILPLVAFYLDFGYTSWTIKDDEAGTKSTEAVMMLFVLVSYLFAVKGKMFEEGYLKLFAILLFMASVFSIAGIGYPQSGRLNMYFTRLVYIYIPIAMSQQRNKTIRSITGFMMVVLFLSVWLIHAFDPNVDYNGYSLIF